MKKILVPTDFSDNATNAIRYAVYLYKDVECTFYLLHTYSPAIYQAEYVLHSPGQIGLGDIYLENSLTQLNALKNKLIEEFGNKKHTFEVHAAFNLLVDEILKVSQAEHIDLVIMGTQGATKAKEILIGTNTVHVIKKACCPVIAIPPNFQYEKPKEILFPTDYEIEYQETQLKELLHIGKEHISCIEVLHVSTGYELNESQLAHKKKLTGIIGKIAHLFHDMPNQEVISAINGFQQKKRVNMLVMIQNKHSFLERMFLKPIINSLGFHIKIPFMVIPPHKDN